MSGTYNVGRGCVVHIIDRWSYNNSVTQKVIFQFSQSVQEYCI